MCVGSLLISKYKKPRMIVSNLINYITALFELAMKPIFVAFLIIACAHTVSCLSFSMLCNIFARYPVGYNPDNRTRPNYRPVPELRPYEPECSPFELTHDKKRGPDKKWQPPCGYDPKKRPKLAFLPQNDKADPDPDHTLKLCTGIWIGNKILEKKCISACFSCISDQVEDYLESDGSI